MSAEIVPFNPNLPATRSDLADLAEQRALLTEFIKSQMREGVDYGIIPGTKNPSLFQPGAQKLAKFFSIRARISSKEKEIDLHQNFAMFSYTAEIYDVKTGTVLAQCEGSANSHEKKYKTRTIQGAREETPIGDVMNTLMKMAQKRAYVGAVIQAVGASDFYTQDIEDADDLRNIGGDAKPVVTAKASVPKAVSAKSTDENSKPSCEECGKPMMISKYHENTWWCASCKLPLPFDKVQS